MAAAGTLDITIEGVANQGFLLAAGTLNVGAATLPPIGQIDVGMPAPAPVFVSGVVLVWDGGGVGFPASLYNTGPSGTFAASLNMPNTPGLNIGLQAVVFTGDAQVAQASNVVDVTIM